MKKHKMFGKQLFFKGQKIHHYPYSTGKQKQYGIKRNAYVLKKYGGNGSRLVELR